MNILDFINRSESEQLANIAIILEKSLNDKIVLSDEEKELLSEIMNKAEELEDLVNNFSAND